MRVERLIERYGPMVYRRALAILGDPEDARDATQDVFIKIMRSSLREEAGASSLLYRVTTNICLNRLRDHRRHTASLERNFRAGQASFDPETERKLLVRELLAEAEQSCAAAAIYVHIEGMSHEEAAEILGVSRRTVGNLLLRFERWARSYAGIGRARATARAEGEGS